jgi:hypothetical protein
MTLKVHAYDPAWVASVRAGGPDAYGNRAERKISDGSGNPCRSCLQMIPEGEEMLVVAARPFPDKQPYAETGPVFFCAEACIPYEGSKMPPCVAEGEDRLLKGYSEDDRIVYGSGAIVPSAEISDACAKILAAPEIAYVDVRSSLNNCFTFRVSRSE